MAFQSKDDILRKWDATPEAREEVREIDQLMKDIGTAQAIISDGLSRYRKKKLKARSKKAAEENPYAELEGYETRQQIQDAYGWDFITEDKMYKLQELWDSREESKQHSTEAGYHDRVTDMLEAATRCIRDDYEDQLFAYAEKRRKMEAEAAKVARENNERQWKRDHGEDI